MFFLLTSCVSNRYTMGRYKVLTQMFILILFVLEGCETVSRETPVLNIYVNEITSTTAKVTITHDGSNRDFYHIFIMEEGDDLQEALQEELDDILSYDEIESALMTGRKKVMTFSRLKAHRTYLATAVRFDMESMEFGTITQRSFRTFNAGEITFEVELAARNRTEADFDIVCSNDEEYWYAFIAENSSKSIQEHIYAELTDAIKDTELHYGEERVAFADLRPGTQYKMIVSAITEDGTPYGTPYMTLFRTDVPEPVSRDGWKIKHSGKVFNQTRKTYDDIIDIEAPKNDRYIILPITTDEYEEVFQGDIAEMLEHAVISTGQWCSHEEWEESKNAYSGNHSVRFSLDSGAYYFLMAGIDTKGNLSGNYKLSRKIIIKPETPFEEYTAWLGDWTVSNDEISFDITLSQGEPNRTFLMSGWEDSDHIIPLGYRPAENIIEIWSMILEEDAVEKVNGQMVKGQWRLTVQTEELWVNGEDRCAEIYRLDENSSIIKGINIKMEDGSYLNPIYLVLTFITPDGGVYGHNIDEMKLPFYMKRLQ